MNTEKESIKESFRPDHFLDLTTDQMDELKKGINNLIWTYAPDSLTLKEGEKIALIIWNMIIKGNMP